VNKKMCSSVKTFSDTFIDILGPLNLIMNTSEGKGMWGSGGVAPFLISVLDGDEWSASHTEHFTPGENAPGSHSFGGCVGPRNLGNLEKRQIFSLYWELNHDSLVA
jgi:hypothetical protein